MKVKSEKLWQDQVSGLRNSLDEESLDIYLRIIEEVSSGVEKEFKAQGVDGDGESPTPGHVIEDVREKFLEIFSKEGYLIPDALADILVVMILHWEYGELLREGLSAIEFSLVAESMAQHLEIRMESAQNG